MKSKYVGLNEGPAKFSIIFCSSLLPRQLACTVMFGCICLLLLLAVQPSQAASISMPMDMEFSGATPPAGASPWLTVHYDDEGSAGTVVLTLETTNLTDSEFVSGLYLNVDPAIDPDDLSFSAPTKAGTFADPTISTETNSFKADGDGKYDILLEFSTSSGSEFGAGEEVEYTISLAGLVAPDFNFLSFPSGGHGPFLAAAHVQGIDQVDLIDPETGEPYDSGWIAPGGGGGIVVPEPTSIALLGAGLAMLTACCRRRM